MPLAQSGRNISSANRVNKYQLLPPLNDTNFSEQYKNYNSQMGRPPLSHSNLPRPQDVPRQHVTLASSQN